MFKRKKYFCLTLRYGCTDHGGIITYPLLKSLCGRWREVTRGLWVLALLSLSFCVYSPHR
ncbi:MAG: hypothetical protein IH577_04865 [Deltaproteobacteria bacterium]|nr:hypothetical protein [Deltaproteobacteria bacterium]